MQRCAIISSEFGWSVQEMEMKDCTVQGEYFMMRSDRLNFTGVQLKGKYSFQYIQEIRNPKLRKACLCGASGLGGGNRKRNDKMVRDEFFVHYKIAPDKMEEIQIRMLKKHLCELMEKIHTDAECVGVKPIVLR